MLLVALRAFGHDDGSRAGPSPPFVGNRTLNPTPSSSRRAHPGLNRPAPGDEGAPSWSDATLSLTEEALLHHLLAHAGEVQGVGAQFAVAWPTEAIDRLGLRPDQGERLRRLVIQLRQRIELEPAEPRHLYAEQGVGYVLCRGAAPDKS